MPEPQLFLGIDISTTSAKALLIDLAGAVIASASTDVHLSTPNPLWSEQDPQEWQQAAIASIRKALESAKEKAGLGGDTVQAVGLTGQMHGLVMLNENGEVLRPAILWNDQRTGEECDEITARVGFERLLAVTGNRALTGFTAPKILWVRRHEPEVYRQIAHILLPKDYVRYCLTGAHATDKADGSGTMLFDLKSRDWSAEILEALDIPPQWLPGTFEGPEITGEISRKAAEATGLRAGTPVVGGGGDQAAQAVGVGAIQPGILAVTLGTSGVVFAATGEPFVETKGRLHAFCHAVPYTWHLMGVMLSAAGSLRWFRDTFAPQKGFDALLEGAQTVPAGSDGLFFLPYLSGERTPHPDPLARGAFVGLTVRHGMAHLGRAVLEGVAFGLKDSMELMRQAGLGEVEQVRISGGGARSPLWRQIIANVFDASLVTVNTSEGAAFGAALLAGTGAGCWKSVAEACQATIHVQEQVAPQEENAARYREIYPLYQGLYPALRTTFHQTG